MIEAVSIGRRPPPDLDVRWLGNAPLSTAERDWFGSLASYEKPYGIWRFIGRMPEIEWRWQHDSEQLADEGLRAGFERDAAHMAAAYYYHGRLKSLTWNKLLSEVHFADWPSRSRALAEGGRGAVDQTIRDIVALGPKPKKAAVRDALKACVEWFNAEDEKLGGVIETEEREDILQLLADICYVARQSPLNGELDEWRTW
jgi:hypothetical protein